ncbi:MAG: hypothetical protein Q7U47_04680 [Paludibacter sp.]|nr:hypothetical protein [Paludibacter sp.]
MRRKNLYYAQLGEAIKLARSSIFEYKRISLILLDNIVENLLITQNSIKLHHLLVMGNLERTEYEKIISNFNRFEKIIQQSFNLELITVSEKNIFDYCHKARNNLYHNLFADTRVTDFCIIYYCDFLEKNFKNYIEIGITSYSESESKSTNEILKVENINSLEGILLNIREFNNSQKALSKKILADIIEDYILQLEDTMENETFETYNILIRTAKDFYNDYFRNTKYNGLNPSGFIKQWYSINEQKIVEIKHEIAEIRNSNMEMAFDKFHTLMLKTEPTYIGLMLYYSNEEYLASLNED